MKKLLLFYLLLIFTSGLVFASGFDDIIDEIIPHSKLTQAELKSLRTELEIQKVFIEGVKKIELRGGEFVDINKSTNTLRDLFISSIQARSKSLPEQAREKVRLITKDGFNTSAIKNILTQTRDKAYSFGRSKKVFMSSIARRFGFDVGLVYALSFQVDFTFPMLMIAQGSPQFGILLATPVSSVVTGSYAAIKSAVKFRQVIKSLGGNQAAIRHFNVYKKMKKFFNQNLFKRYDLFDIYVGGQTYAFTTAKRTMLNRVLEKVGWKSGITYEGLLRHMKDNNILPEVVQRVQSSNTYPEAKLIKLLVKIQQSDDSEVFHSIRDKFGKYINEINSLPEFSKQRKWVKRIMDVTDFDQFIKQLSFMPKDIPPAIFDTIWREKVIVGTSKSIANYSSKAEYTAFRKLINLYDQNLRGDFANSIETKIPPHLHKRFTDYAYDALGGVGICHNLFRRKTQNTIPFL